MLILAFDHALRRWYMDRSQKLPKTQAGFISGTYGNATSTSIYRSHNALTARMPSYNPDTFAVKLRERMKFELTNATTYRQHVTVYKHVQRRSYFPNASFTEVSTTYLGPKAADHVKFNALDSNNSIFIQHGIDPTYAYTAAATASYDYMTIFRQATVPTAIQNIMQIGAYIQFYGLDPTWERHSDGLALPHPRNFYNTNSDTVVSEEKKFHAPGISGTSGTLTYALFPSFDAKDTVDGTVVAGEFMEGKNQPQIAQTMYGSTADWAEIQSNRARPYNDDSSTHSAYTMESIGAPRAVSGTDHGTTGTTALTNMGVMSTLSTADTSNRVNKTQMFDATHWQSGWGRPAGSMYEPDYFPAVAGTSGVLDEIETMYTHLDYRHTKNIVFRRAFKLRGITKFTVEPGDRVSFTVASPRRIITPQTGNWAMQNLSRVLPNASHVGAGGTYYAAAQGLFPSYAAALGNHVSRSAAKCDMKGATFVLMSVVGQRALNTDRRGNATLVPDMSLRQTYSCSYQYCKRRNPLAYVPGKKTSRHQHWRADDTTVERATAASQYRIPGDTQRSFVNLGNMKTVYTLNTSGQLVSSVSQSTQSIAPDTVNNLS